MNGTNGRTLLIVLLLCCFVSCREDTGDNGTGERTPLPEATLVKGHAVYGHEIRTIRPCGEQEAVWAIDSTQLLWILHGELAPGVGPYEEVFVVVEGTMGEPETDGSGAEYRGTFYVERVLYAAGEGWGCDLDLNRFRFRLAGNEPFWSTVMTDTTVELNRLEGGQQVWNEVESEPIDGGYKFVAQGAGAEVAEVTIIEEPCRDTMSGAYYGFTATVAVSGNVLNGCALRGLGR